MKKYHIIEIVAQFRIKYATLLLIIAEKLLISHRIYKNVQ